jgi:hypothetical protein
MFSLGCHGRLERRCRALEAMAGRPSFASTLWDQYGNRLYFQPKAIDKEICFGIRQELQHHQVRHMRAYVMFVAQRG